MQTTFQEVDLSPSLVELWGAGATDMGQTELLSFSEPVEFN
jgi:hypothetical protein